MPWNNAQPRWADSLIGLRVSSQEAIERRIGGILRPLESRDRGRDIVVSKIAPQERFERVRIFLDPSDLCDDIAGRLLAHFNWVENRKLGLILERGRAAIPELRRLKHRVQHGRRIALAMLVLDARGRRAVAAMIGKSLGGIVAGFTCDRVIDRKALVLEQFFAESGKLRRRLAPLRHGQGIELRRNAKGQGGFKRRLLLGSSKCERSRRGSSRRESSRRRGSRRHRRIVGGSERHPQHREQDSSKYHSREASYQLPARKLHRILPKFLFAKLT